MEIAFHSNKCALKDSLRLIKIGKNPCWKKRYQLFKYSEGLINTNENIIALHSEISEYSLQEFIELQNQYIALANTFISRQGECTVCLKNCLEGVADETPNNKLSEDEITAYTNSPELFREKQIAQAADKMKRLNTKTEFMESIINMHKEELDRISYTNTSAIEYTHSHLAEMEEALARRKRAILLKRWLGGITVFFCFLSLLLLRPFVV
ncbi:hypothetical protein NEIRO03_1700 [Nematocida sp. AWRm78]|nr:hypothetical protein NEIRO02_1735 [Nematocida sp. AWRm79]KAI5184247.1 hypothetical protein NEIRO03_1700 [Nematocida sp. AWRm78]